MQQAIMLKIGHGAVFASRSLDASNKSEESITEGDKIRDIAIEQPFECLQAVQ